MTQHIVQPAPKLRGMSGLPGDKSISHRTLILGSVADGLTTVTGLSESADVDRTKTCLEALGVKISEKDGEIQINGEGLDGLQAPSDALDAGNSGTTMRLLAGLLASLPFTSTIDGDKSLRSRPMKRIIDPLKQMGAKIDSKKGNAPLTFHKAKLKPIEYESPIASAQIKSCLLLASLSTKGTMRVTEPTLSRDHTERMLRKFGVKIKSLKKGVELKTPVTLKATHVDVPGDLSAAAFFLVAGSLVNDSRLELQNVGVNPSRTGILDALEHMGANITRWREHIRSREPRANLMVETSQLMPYLFKGALIPRIIDELPIIAVAATQARGRTVIKDAQELRVKESDRIATTADNLRRMGATIEATDDGWIIDGPTPLKGAEIDSFGDHRIAMAFAVAGLIAEGETVINDVDCVNTSFPNFFTTLDSFREE